MITLPTHVLSDLDTLAWRIDESDHDLWLQVDTIIDKAGRESRDDDRPVELPLNVEIVRDLLDYMHNDLEWCTCHEGYEDEDGNWVEWGCNWWGWNDLDEALKAALQQLGEEY
jgi:hypothetical protein